jgi:hypothetical protein
MGRAGHVVAKETRETHMKLWGKNLKRSDLEKLGVDMTIILKYILYKQAADWIELAQNRGS